MRRLAIACVLVATTARVHAEAPPLPKYAIDVRVDWKARTAAGHAKIEVSNPRGEPLHELWLWRYPERFAERSKKLNDYNFHWVYPYAFNPAHMTTKNVTVDGRAAAAEVRDHPFAGKGTLVRVALDPPLDPGATVTLDVDFETRLPKRYGRFGCALGTCVMGPGFYPMVAPLDAAGDPLAALPGRGDYSLRLFTPRLSDVVINGELDTLETGGRLSRTLGVQSGLALVVGKIQFRKFERVEKGVRITLIAPHSRGTPSPVEYVLPYQPSNRVDRALDVAAEVVDFLSELGAPLPDELRMVETPLRIELAETMPHMVLVSNQIFDIFPLQRFLKFHEFDLARALFAEDITQQSLATETPDDLRFSPEVSAAHLVDLYTLRAYRKAEFLREIMAYASFIPAIDRVMYAPQIPFASSYFATLEDPDPLRDSPAQFNNDLPTGKVVASKLRDLLGDAAMLTIAKAQLAGEQLRPLAEKLRGASLDWFWKQWLGPYPAVDYRFVFVKSERRSDGKWSVVARVEKRGPHPPVEPVDVRAVDGKGVAQTLTWDGVGRQHDYVFVLEHHLSVIEIDPRGRLVEELPGANDDLRFDDRKPPRWKFIYNNFGGLLTFFPTLALDLSIDFSLQRILDLKNQFRFVVYRSQSTQIGIISQYTRNFGRKITAANLSSDFVLTIAASRIDPTFAQAIGAAPKPGTQLGLSVGWDYDDRLFIWEPRRALTFSASLGANETILDSGQVLSQGTGAAGWESIVPLADGHGLAMFLGGGATFGDLKIARQMLSAGGGNALRGYSVEQLLGRWDVTGRVEWRHLFTHDIDFNIMHSLYVRGMSGGLFVEGGIVSPCESYVPDGKSYAADVGYSLRFFADWFGVSQTTLNLDFAVPLIRHDRSCFGELVSAAGSVPFGFFFSFGPPW
jgi:hypothetical protein